MRNIITLFILLWASQANAYSPVPNCIDTAGQHLNYTLSTNAYSCGTSGGGAAGGSQYNIQLNNGSSGFSGSSALTSDSSNNLYVTSGMVAIGTSSAPIFGMQIQGNNVYTAYTGAAGTIALQNATIPAKLMYEGFDPNLGSVGGGYIQSVYSGVAYEPTFLSPAGGGVAIGSTLISAGSVLDLSSNTSSLLLPVGTTGTRPVVAIRGMLRAETTSPPGIEFPASTVASNNYWGIISINATTTNGSGTYTSYALAQRSSFFGGVNAGSGVTETSTCSGSNIGIGNNAFSVTGSGALQCYYANNTFSAGGIGTQDVAIGDQAMGAISTSSCAADADGLSLNTAVGFLSLNNLNCSGGVTNGGRGNTGIGEVAGQHVGNGVYNTFIGLESGDIGVNPNYETLIGALAGRNITGNANVIIGYNSGATITSGAGNVVIGQAVASTTLTTGQGNILIGTTNSTDTPSTGTSSWLNIGNTVYGDLSTSRIGIGSGLTSITAGAVLDLSSNTTTANSSMILPVGTTGTRPATGKNGMLRYTTTNNTIEGYINNAWSSLALASNAGVSAFSGDGILVKNSSSTGAVTATLANATAKSLWGNTSSSSAAPDYQTSPVVSGSVTAATLIASATTGTDLTLGTSALTSTATPVAINLGGTYSNSAGANCKIMLLNDGTGIFCIGVSQGSMDFSVTGGAYAGSYNFYVNGNGNDALTIGSTGLVGVGSASPRGIFDLSQNTGAMLLPTGTTGARPTAVAGMGRYNSTLTLAEGYINGLWAQFLSGSDGTPTCGTGCSSITSGSTDAIGSATTGAAVTSVTINFSGTLAAAPRVCEVGDNSLLGFASVTSGPTTSSFTIGLSSALTSAKVTWICVQ